jgi:hypothetical protein
MKKPGIIILLLIYFFTQMGTIAWYYYKPLLHAICYTRFHFPSFSKNDKEYIIKTDIASFKKAKQDEHEILWKGAFYDIKEVEINNNEITIKAEKDIIETAWTDIYYSIREQVKKNRSPRSSSGIRFCQWILKLYVPVQTLNSYIAVPHFAANNSLYACNYLHIFFPDGPSQPPDFNG